MIRHLVYLILKFWAWEICNMKVEFAKKSHNTVTNHNFVLCVVRIFLKQTLWPHPSLYWFDLWQFLVFCMKQFCQFAYYAASSVFLVCYFAFINFCGLLSIKFCRLAYLLNTLQKTPISPRHIWEPYLFICINLQNLW